MGEPRHREKAVYQGRRLSGGGKVLQKFQLVGGEDLFFGNIRGVSIGYTYRCSKTQMLKRPERTDDERIDNPEWDAADALVDAHHAEARAEAKAKKESSPALRNAIAALTPLMKGRGYLDRKALIEFLSSKVKP